MRKLFWTLRPMLCWLDSASVVFRKLCPMLCWMLCHQSTDCRLLIALTALRTDLFVLKNKQRTCWNRKWHYKITWLLNNKRFTLFSLVPVKSNFMKLITKKNVFFSLNTLGDNNLIWIIIPSQNSADVLVLVFVNNGY